VKEESSLFISGIHRYGSQGIFLVEERRKRRKRRKRGK